MPETKAKKKIKRELPAAGTIMKSKYKGVEYKARVIKDKNSSLGRAIKFNGKLYPSMTAAAKSVTKGSINGWTFWKF